MSSSKLATGIAASGSAQTSFNPDEQPSKRLSIRRKPVASNAVITEIPTVSPMQTHLAEPVVESSEGARLGTLQEELVNLDLQSDRSPGLAPHRDRPTALDPRRRRPTIPDTRLERPAIVDPRQHRDSVPNVPRIQSLRTDGFSGNNSAHTPQQAVVERTRSSRPAPTFEEVFEAMRKARSIRTTHDLMMAMREFWPWGIVRKGFGDLYLMNLEDRMRYSLLPENWRCVEAADVGCPVYLVPNGHEKFRTHFHHPLHMTVKAEQHARRLGLAHVDALHSCDFCRNVTIDFRTSKIKSWMTRPLEGKRVMTGRTWEDIARAQQGGCPFFTQIFPLIELSDDGRLPARQAYAQSSDGICLKIGGYSRSDVFFDGQPGAFNYQLMERARKKLNYELSFRATGVSDLPTFTLCSDPISPPDVELLDLLGGPMKRSAIADPQTWAWIFHTLQNCTTEHMDCRMHGLGGTVRQTQLVRPARLLDLFVAPHIVALVMTASQPVQPIQGVDNDRWCCLSYTWGGPQRIQTKISTLEQHQAGIPFCALPMTLRDAVIVCRRLRIRYLWIDALCIVQDDAADKQRELAIMSEIYLNARITIVAACAEHVEDGFLYDKGYYYDREESAPPIRLPCISPSGEARTVMACESSDEPEQALDYGNFTETRGWCYQERVLSPRMLYYGLHGLSYICQTNMLRNGNYEIPEPERRDRKIPQRNAERRFEATQHTSLSSTWVQIVEDYTARFLGRPNDDILNAISGVAKYYAPALRSNPSTGGSEDFHEAWEDFKNDMFDRRPKWKPVKKASKMTPDQYAAGLMRSVHDLTWYVDVNAPLEAKPIDCYRAPSWSWASIDSKVTYWASDKYVRPQYALGGDDPKMHRESRVLEQATFSATPKDPNVPYGAVTSGVMRIATTLLDCQVWCGHVNNGRVSTVKVASVLGIGMQLKAFLDHKDANTEMCQATNINEHSLFRAVLLIGDKTSQWCGLLLKENGTPQSQQSFVRIGFWTCCGNAYHGIFGHHKSCKGLIESVFSQRSRKDRANAGAIIVE